MKSSTIILPLLIGAAAFVLTACGQNSSPIPAVVTAPAFVQSYQTPARSGQIAVRFKPEATRTAIMQFNARYGLRTLHYNPQLNVYIMEPVNPRINVNSLIRTMSKDPAVDFAEINHEIKVNPVVDMQIKPIFNE